MSDLLLLGCGGHGRVLLDALLLSRVQVAGILDPDLTPGQEVFGVPVLGGDELLETCQPETTQLANGLGVVPGFTRRSSLYGNWRQRGFNFVTVVHPSAMIGRETLVGAGSQIMAGAIVQCNAVIGENCVVNTSASIDHDCQIGDHVFIGPGAIICGNVTLASGSFIGAGAVLIPGVKIGSHSIVGAGAIVNRDVPDDTLVAGKPADVRRREVAHD
jgi:sugar O-acyltransferase (sialic acid O-acetyltransferase NeuD family)